MTKEKQRQPDANQEFARKYRPTKFSEVVGQRVAVAQLQAFGRSGNLPHCIMLCGPRGCGKTTLARILQGKLGCSELDWTEINAAESRGIDMAREISERMWSKPLAGPVRMWLLDECHRLTADAQSALLKPLEEPPDHAYFVLCTTEPEKVIATVRSRATEVKVVAVSDSDMAGLIDRVASAEGVEVSEDLRERIVRSSEGSPRKALVLLNQVAGIEGEEERLAVASAGVAGSEAIDLARALVKSNVQWSAVAKLLKSCDDDPEAVRRLVLGYFRSILLGSSGKTAERAYTVICSFEKAFYDGGKASLAAACWEVVTGKR